MSASECSLKRENQKKTLHERLPTLLTLGCRKGLSRFCLFQPARPRTDKAVTRTADSALWHPPPPPRRPVSLTPPPLPPPHPAAAASLRRRRPHLAAGGLPFRDGMRKSEAAPLEALGAVASPSGEAEGEAEEAAPSESAAVEAVKLASAKPCRNAKMRRSGDGSPSAVTAPFEPGAGLAPAPTEREGCAAASAAAAAAADATAPAASLAA